jgi:L-fuconolactonase
MYGSDWPVCEVAASYVEVKDALTTILGGTPKDVFAGTAIGTYELEIE